MRTLLLLLLLLLFTGCFHYRRLTHDQQDILIDGVGVSQSLTIAEALMVRKDKKSGVISPNSLGYWALRGQIIDSSHAVKIDSVYWQVIDSVQNKFHIWHYTWAICDFYRLGDSNVQGVLYSAYKDAKKRAIAIGKEKFVAQDVQHLGFFHGGGWRAARNFLVVPGRRGFPQSVDDFYERKGERWLGTTERKDVQ